MYLLGPALFNLIYVAIRIYNKKYECAVHAGDYGFSIIKNVRFFNDSMDRDNKKSVRVIIDAALVFSVLLPGFVFLVSKVYS
jgi:hypothetical protein